MMDLSPLWVEKKDLVLILHSLADCGFLLNIISLVTAPFLRLCTLAYAIRKCFSLLKPGGAGEGDNVGSLEEALNNRQQWWTGEAGLAN